ncbi:sulfotransferase family protein [Parvibaculum sp.]|uniref:sulfotransferase family protein n=1 Tax=Parvibaculum sp. TaxID=2024848 RepID=UPI00391989E9
MKRLFIIGAPKCGTTSLSNWLAGHPAIHFSAIKEPHFYATDLRNRPVADPVRYARLFESATDEVQFHAEGSTWYLRSDRAIPAIIDQYPDARFIVLTRDPVTMAVALFFHNRNKLYESRTDLLDAWCQSSDASGMGTGSDAEPVFTDYRRACSLGSLLDRLYGWVKPENVLHIRLEDMSADPAAEYARCLRFLGLSPDHRTDFAAYNSGWMHRSAGMQRFFKKSAALARKMGLTQYAGLKNLIIKVVFGRRLDARPVSDEAIARITEDLRHETRRVDELFALHGGRGRA